MKTNSSRFILAAELIAIILFHAVKIKQSEKHPADADISRINKVIPAGKPVIENKASVEYMLVNLVK